MEAKILEGAARAMFVQWWADQCSCGFDSETCRNDGDGIEGWDPNADHIPNDPGGVELMDIAPETPESARVEARAMLKCVKFDNPSQWGEVLKRPEVMHDPDGFGHYLAMEALGHGVAWSDSHEDHELRLPLCEYMGYTIDEGTYV